MRNEDAKNRPDATNQRFISGNQSHDEAILSGQLGRGLLAQSPGFQGIPGPWTSRQARVRSPWSRLLRTFQTFWRFARFGLAALNKTQVHRPKIRDQYLLGFRRKARDAGWPSTKQKVPWCHLIGYASFIQGLRRKIQEPLWRSTVGILPHVCLPFHPSNLETGRRNRAHVCQLASEAELLCNLEP